MKAITPDTEHYTNYVNTLRLTKRCNNLDNNKQYIETELDKIQTQASNEDPLLPATILTASPIRNAPKTIENIIITKVGNEASTFKGTITLDIIHHAVHNGCSYLKFSKENETAKLNTDKKSTPLKSILKKEQPTISIAKNLTEDFAAILDTPIGNTPLTFIIDGKILNSINGKPVTKNTKVKSNTIIPSNHNDLSKGITYGDLYKELNNGKYSVVAEWIKDFNGLHLRVAGKDGSTLSDKGFQIKDKNGNCITGYETARFNVPSNNKGDRTQAAVNITVNNDYNAQTKGGRYSAKNNDGLFEIDLKNGNYLHFRLSPPAAKSISVGDETYKIYESHRGRGTEIAVNFDILRAKEGVFKTVEFLNRGLNLDKQHRKYTNSDTGFITINANQTKELGEYGFSYDLTKGLILENPQLLDNVLNTKLPSVLNFFKSLRHSAQEKVSLLLQATNIATAKLGLANKQAQEAQEAFFANRDKYFAELHLDVQREEKKSVPLSQEIIELVKPLETTFNNVQLSSQLDTPNVFTSTLDMLPNSVNLTRGAEILSPIQQNHNESLDAQTDLSKFLLLSPASPVKRDEQVIKPEALEAVSTLQNLNEVDLISTRTDEQLQTENTAKEELIKRSVRKELFKAATSTKQSLVLNMQDDEIQLQESTKDDLRNIIKQSINEALAEHNTTIKTNISPSSPSPLSLDNELIKELQQFSKTLNKVLEVCLKIFKMSTMHYFAGKKQAAYPNNSDNYSGIGAFAPSKVWHSYLGRGDNYPYSAYFGNNNTYRANLSNLLI